MLLQIRQSLAKMAFLLRDANESTCQKKNPYEAEYSRILREFDANYGIFGDGLKTLEEKQKRRDVIPIPLSSKKDIFAYCANRLYNSNL